MRWLGRDATIRWNVSCLAVLMLSLAISASAAAETPIEKVNTLGPVQAKVTLDPPKPLIGDPVTLTVTVTAEKDVELLMPEFGEALERFAIVDFVPREQIDDQGRTIAMQQYRLQPPSSGTQSIPPLLIEFIDRRPGQKAAPDDLDAYELLTERIDFEVTSVLPKGATATLKPPLGALPPLVPLAPARWPWVVGLLGVLIVAAPFVWRWFTAYRRLARRRSAFDIAMARLEALLRTPHTDQAQVKVFYMALSSIVRRYLEDRFLLRAPELTTDEFLDVCTTSPDLSREHQTLLRDFLRQADLVKFAGIVPSPDVIEQSVGAARRFLDDTRQNAPLIDEATAMAVPAATYTSGDDVGRSRAAERN